MISSGLGSTILSSTIGELSNNVEVRFIPIVQPVQYRSVGSLHVKKLIES